MAEKEEAEKKAAEEWMKNEMGAQKQEQKIQKRIAEKFRIQIKQKGQTIRDIFIAFDEDGGGTIDHEELRDGFAALGVRLNDREFTMMLKIWDKDDEGEIEFDVFADMFEKTLLVLIWLSPLATRAAAIPLGLNLMPIPAAILVGLVWTTWAAQKGTAQA